MSAARTSLYPKLRPRPNGPPREEIIANQRMRLCGALARGVASCGYDETSVSELCRLAGISKRTFYEQFESKQACFLGVYQEFACRVLGRVGEAVGDAPDPETSIPRATGALVGAAAQYPQAAHLVLVEAPRLGLVTSSLREQVRQQFATEFGRCLSDPARGIVVPPLLARAMICGIERAIGNWLLDNGSCSSELLAHELSGWLLSYASPALWRLPTVDPRHFSHERPPGMIRPPFASEQARAMRATCEIVAQEGYERLSSARIIRHAGVTERWFRAHYGSAQDCFLDAIDLVGTEAVISVAHASRGHHGEPEGISRGLSALLARAAEDPNLRGVAFRELPAAGALAIDRRERLLAAFTELLAKSLRAKSSPLEVNGPRGKLEATVGALWGTMQHLVQKRLAYMLPSLAGHAGYIALTPFIGAEDAVAIARGARQPAVSAQANRAPASQAE